MLQVLVSLISLPVIIVLLVFNLRRLLFTLTALVARQRPSGPQAAQRGAYDWPDVLILVPCRDEEETVLDLCEALSRLDYPRDRYHVVLINDGSHDQTGVLMEEFIRGRAQRSERSVWSMLSLPTNIGKASALNAALAQFSFGEILYVFDADHRPKPDVLKRAVRYFDDPRVAGVTGRTLPSNPLVSPSAYYATVETTVHQMVTMRAKDRLGLAPALLGSNCGYRRAVLAECGGFREGALLEDSDLTLIFALAGYRVRFMEDAIAYHQVPETIGGYLRQHTRWARGFNQVARNHILGLIRSRRLSLPLRVELVLFATGYLDRIALLGAGVLMALSLLNPRLFPFPHEVLYLALLTPLAQIIALFAEQRASRAMWLRLPLVPLFLAVDLLAVAQAMTNSLLHRERVWTRTARATPVLGHWESTKEIK